MWKPIGLLLLLISAAHVSGGDAVPNELKKFVGTWKVVSTKVNGRELPQAETSGNDQVAYDRDGSWWQRSEGETIHAGVITAIDTGASPRSLDYKVTRGGNPVGKTIRVIYEFTDADTYRVCYGPPDGERPTDFSCEKGSGHTLCVLKREKR